MAKIIRLCVALALVALALALVTTVSAAFDTHTNEGGDTTLRLISFSEDERDRRWMTPEEVLALSLEDGGRKGFIDITDSRTPIPMKAKPSFDFPSYPSQQAIVNTLIPQLSSSRMEEFLTEFSSFQNRYYTSSCGYDSAVWLRDYMESFITTQDASCNFFNHSDWLQPSVVCEIVGSDLADEIVIISAHSDSTAPGMPSGRAPGADDDGSGVTSFAEVFRVLLANDFKPRRTLQFIGWAAEEVGLRGSQDIARTYKENGVNVYAVYQNEMSGYLASGRGEITLIQDNVDADLTSFVTECVNEYCDIPPSASICGYGCSDHASWTNEGYAAVCTAEAGPWDGNVNPNMHTSGDTVDKLDFTFHTEFTKLALATAVELSLY